MDDDRKCRRRRPWTYVSLNFEGQFEEDERINTGVAAWGR